VDPLGKVNVGSGPNDGTGDPLRDAFVKINEAFDVLNAAFDAANGIAVLGTDRRVAPSRSSKPVALSIAAGVDYDTFTDNDDRFIAGGASANAPPTASAVMLEVRTFGAGTLQVATERSAEALRFWRIKAGTSGAWSAWQRTVALDSTGRLPSSQAPIVYASAIAPGTNPDSVTTPGTYYVNADGAALWPLQIAGTLTVEAAEGGNQQVSQTFTTRTGTGGVQRRFVRVRFSGAWGQWQEIARLDDVIPLAQKGSAGGVATLGETGAVPASQLSQAVLATARGAAGGVAALDATSKIPVAQMPADYSALSAAVLGRGQSLQNMLASRAAGVSYTNTTGRPIIAYIRGDVTSAYGNLAANVGGAFCGMSTYPSVGAAIGLTLLVPAGATYLCAASGATISSWFEYR